MEISEKTENFILEHCKDDTNALRLKYAQKSNKLDFPIEFALLQIEARRKAQRKLATFLDNPQFIFPDLLSAEQATHESVATFHASLLSSSSSLLDMTAGLGIDDFTFADSGINVTSCEIDETKATALRHNAEALGHSDKMSVMNVDSTEYLKNCQDHYDVVFADPARRGSEGKRLYALSDCQPDILQYKDTILKISDRLLIKSSPLLDIAHTRSILNDLSHVYIVCLKGEAKEVLIDIQKDKPYSGTTVVDLDHHGMISTFTCHSPLTSSTNYISYADRSSPSDYKYLYEPNSGVMKTGAWADLAERFPDIRKADPNTHIFLSDSFYEDFPGRVLAIRNSPDKKALKALKGSRINVVARNHPLSAPEVEKKHSLIPGGETYLYAFRYKGKPTYLITDPVNYQIQDPV